MASSKFEQDSILLNVDLDYFAIWIPSNELLFQGPFVNVCDMYPDFKIQDPVVKDWKYRICVTFSPYIICYEDDDVFSKRKEIVKFLNFHGVSVLCESLNPGTLVFKQHWVPTQLLIDALLSVNIQFLRISSYGMKGKLTYLKHTSFWKILMNGHQNGGSFKLKEGTSNVVFDIAQSVKMENIILFKRSSSVPVDKMWPMCHWLGEGFGGLMFHYDDDPTISIKLYSLLHHHLSSCSKVDWHIPKNICTLRSKEKSLQGLLDRLKKEENIGGYRIEVRIHLDPNEGGFENALDCVLTNKLLKLKHLEKTLYGVLGQIHSQRIFWKKEIVPTSYFQFVEGMLALSKHLPDHYAGGGLIYGKNSQSLSLQQKEMWTDLMLSFGHTPSMFTEAKILLRDDTLHLWIGKWDNKSDLKFFENVRLRRSQSFHQFISEQTAINMIFATLQRMKANQIGNDAIQSQSETSKKSSIVKHLKVRHPPKNPLKYCATYKKNGGCTKAFNTIEELLKFLENDLEKKKKKKWQEVYQSNLD
jgi:hypothetical protein